MEINPDAIERLNDFKKNLSAFINNVTSGLLVFSETIRKFVDSYAYRFAEIAQTIAKFTRPLRAIKLLAENQYVFWDFFTQEFVDEILESDNINRTLREINERTKYVETLQLIDKTTNDSRMVPFKKLYTQAVNSFHSGDRELALVGFMSVIDGILSTVSHSNTTSIFKRADAILKKLEENDELESDEYGILALTYTFRETMQSLSANSDFSKKEPRLLNRHWIMHGRSRRKKTKLDCVKMIRFIYSILLIDDLARKEAERIE